LAANADVGAWPRTRASEWRRVSRLSVLLLPPLLPIVVFAPALAGLVLLAPRDGFLYYLPIHRLVAEAWRSGHLPAWNPFELSGAPLLANQAGAFYPFTALFLLLPNVYANNLFVVLHLAVGAAGACLFARRLTNDDWASVVGGFAFVSSGFVFGHLGEQGVLAGAVWMPWALLGYDLLAERRTRRRFLLVTGSLAMSLLCGHSQMFFVTVAVVAIYAAATPKLAQPDGRRTLGTFALVVAAAAALESLLPASLWILGCFMLFFFSLGVLGAASAIRNGVRARRRDGHFPTWVWLLPTVTAAAMALAAVQVLPTAELSTETIRSHAQLTAASSYFFSPSHLLLLLFPYLFGNSYSVAPFNTLYQGHWNPWELAGYPGLAALVLAAAGLPRIRRDPRALAMTLAAGFSLVLALGRTTGAGVLVAFLPVYGQFRAWSRYAVVIDLVVALFAAYGVAHLRTAAAGELRAAVRRAWKAVGALALVGVAVPLLPAVNRYAVGGREHVLAIGIPVGCAAIGGLCVSLFGRSKQAALALCCAVVALDGFVSFGAYFEWRRSPTPQEAASMYSVTVPPAWGTLPETRDGLTRFLVAARVRRSWPEATAVALSDSYPQVTDAKGIPSVNGYGPLAPRRYSDVVGGMSDNGFLHRPGQFTRRRSWLLDVLRISTVLVPRDEAPRATPPWFDSRVEAGSLVRYTYRPRLPAAFLIGKVRLVDAETALAAGRGKIAFDPTKSALVEGRCALCAAMKARGNPRGVVARWRPGSVRATVDAARPALFVVSQSWVSGWSATVDGRAAPVVRADALVLGVPVPAGRHEVRLEYHTPGLKAGSLISGSTVLGFVLVPALLRLRRRREARGPLRDRSR
jgi:Bacterial membrane protein YfhO